MSGTEINGNLPDYTMNLGDHLEELRVRLILALLGLCVALIICLFFGKAIISFIEKPYLQVMGADARLQTLGPADGFVSYMKISLTAGLILSCPWVFYHVWMFIAVGLYQNEKSFVRKVIPFSVVLFIAGSLFFIFIVAPLSLGFLVKFNRAMLGVSSNFTFQKYVSFVTTLMVVFGLGFQTPIIIFFLSRTGLVSLTTLAKSRKYVLLAAFIIAAVVTPPDMISQITLALPLYLLFEVGMLLSYLTAARNTKKT